jgi:hypothetical protein
MAAPSMAAALAASLPATQAAPTPSAPQYEAIPASMSKLIDVEAEIPVTSVQLDGLVRDLNLLNPAQFFLECLCLVPLLRIT